MKNNVVFIVTNLLICAIIVVTAVVGFLGGSAVTVSDGDGTIYYRSQSESAVSLMFNVYQGTDEVYEILDILDGYGAEATFFIGGSWADDNVDCVREIASRGHEIASHGYFHKDHAALSYEENIDEIVPSVKLLSMICGKDISLFAPPSGAFNDYTVSACLELGLKMIMWSKDTIDWRDNDVNLIVSRATNGLEAGDFVLMHPTQSTVKALPAILNYIRNCGFAACTVSYSLGE